jgi:CRISPR type III-A-associated RAMP protein Csm4
MNPALLIRLRPSTPWRIGPSSGARAEVSPVFHSDSLYSAVTLAFEQFGLLEEWLGVTSGTLSVPAVRFTSCFPWQRSLLYAPPPAGLWPPAGISAKLRAKGATLLPTSVIADLLEGKVPDENDWVVDGHSGCLIPAGSRSSSGPFRFLIRSSVAVDRVTGGHVLPHSAQCVQFAPAAGLWCAAEFSSQTAYAVWAPRLESVFRLLADSGLGGMRSRGFGRSRGVDFRSGPLAEMLFGPAARPAGGAWWTLSLVSPAATDDIHWDAGCYRLEQREGRVGSGAAAGSAKLASRLVAEGSVLVAGHAPVGSSRDVAPAGSPHPIYRAGYAVALPIAWPVTA